MGCVLANRAKMASAFFMMPRRLWPDESVSKAQCSRKLGHDPTALKRDASQEEAVDVNRPSHGLCSMRIALLIDRGGIQMPVSLYILFISSINTPCRFITFERVYKYTLSKW